MGEFWWDGDSDLSGRVALTEADGKLTVIVDVTDDDITVARADQPVSYGDSVEVYLDFRSAKDQGKPVYGRDVVAILAVPESPEGGPPRWQPLDGLAPVLADVSFACDAKPDGYTVTLSVPLTSVLADDGPATFGLDVGINDADGGSTRSTQMFYSGHADNYLDPSRLAGVSTAKASRRLWRVTLR